MTSETATPVATHTGKDGKGILITEPAMKQLATLLPAQGEGKVLRVGVRSGGCSGMSYTMDFIDGSEIREDDERYIYEPSGAPSFTVVSDPKSLLYIYG
ncbi:MAG: HesB/IscA family protein, partial [Vulcanococcus sp.]